MCGMRRKEDIAYANEVKPDAIGYIFFSKSKRYVTGQQARELDQNLDQKILSVGVFVNETIEKVTEIANEVPLDVIQLHGDEDVIYIEQYGKLTSDNNERVQPCAVQTAGTIKYRAALDTGYIYYGLKCTYDTKNLGSTTYTINNFVGRMVDLIALVVGALTLPNIVAEAFLDALIKGLGITVASGMIKNAVTDTVSCIKTQYTWNLVDTTAASHQKNVYGYKYYITDVKSAAKNNNYYEGYVPKDWKTQSLAVNFHNEMFTYNAWNVVGWA